MARWGQVATTSNRRRGGAAAAADVTYVKAHINRDGGVANNNVLDLEFSDTVTGSDFEDGITIGVGINGSTSDYTAIDKSETSSIALAPDSDKYIRYTFDGTVSTFQGWNSGTSKGHNLQVSISSSPLNVADVSAGAGNSRVFENNSTVNLLDGIVEVWHMADADAVIDSANDMDENSHGPTYVSYTPPPYLGNGAQMSRTGPKYLSHADSSVFSPGNTNFTWSLWVKFDTVALWQYLISKWNWSGSTDAEYLLYTEVSSSELHWIKKAGGNVKVPAPTALDEIDTWYNIVAYHDADNTDIGIIVNNVAAIPVDTNTGVDAHGLPIAFGSSSEGAAAGSVAGIMDEIALHSKALSADEVTDLYNGGDGKAYPYIPDS